MIDVEYSTLGAETFQGRVISRADYSTFIKGGPGRAFIEKPGRVVAQRIANRLDGLLDGAI